MRALFLSHGRIENLFGALRVQASLRQGFAELPGVTARFTTLPAWPPPARALAHRFCEGEHDLHVLRWHLIEAVRGRRALRRELERFRPDVVHFNSHTLALLCIDRMSDVSTFLSVDATIADWHSLPEPSDPDRMSPWIRPSAELERRAFSKAAVVLPWSPWASRSVVRSAPDARVLPIHPGIDVRAYAPGAEADADAPVRVLFVGGRFRQKGGDDLLAALDGWLGERVQLDVVTKEPVAGRRGVTVHDLDGDDPRLLRLYQRADVFCLPTYRDAYPWVLLEAMACGTAIVASDIAAIPDLVGPDAGLLVRPGDGPGLRSALASLIEDRPRRQQMARAARARAEAHFDSRTSARALLDAFAEALARRPG